MAAISRELAQSLDSLRDTILEATVFLSKLPGTSEAWVNIPFLNGDEEYQRAYLGVKEIGGNSELVVEFVDESSDTGTVKAVLDMAVATRVQVANYIPQLIEEAKTKTDALPSKISTTVKAIRNAIE